MKRWIFRGAICAVLLLLLVGAGNYMFASNRMQYGPPADRSAWEDQEPSVNAGQLAYIQRDVSGARRIWQAVAEDETARAEDRTESYRLLARTSWRIYQDQDEALAFAEAAEDLGTDEWENAVTQSNVLRERGDTGDALDAARLALSRIDSHSAYFGATNALARAALAQVDGKSIAEQTADDRAVMREALNAFAPVFDNPPADLTTSELALELAVRLEDGDALMAAWGSYYHSPTGVSSLSDQSEAAALLQHHASEWPRSGSAEVAEALALSHFYEEAWLISQDQTHADIWQFREDLIQHTDEYYRQVAMSQSNNAFLAQLRKWQYENGVEDIAATFWATLSDEPFDENVFMPHIMRTYAFYANLGWTSGVFDLHMGHRVLDTTYTADQHGRQADLRYVAVGRMVSNGYESWLWDGRQEHGGWASADTIYHVRPAYVDGGAHDWDRLTNPARRNEQEEDIARLTAEDDALAASGDLVYLPGLSARLRWQSRNQVLETVQATADPARMREAFILEMNNAVRQSSIFAHEGRHSLDKVHASQEVRDSSEELEFRAKISEIVFNPYPRIAFGSIFNPNMGDPSPHGSANGRLMQGALDWMDAHRDEIVGLDPDRPLLPQFDLLTDDQIRAAFLAQDPWAQEAS